MDPLAGFKQAAQQQHKRHASATAAMTAAQQRTASAHQRLPSLFNLTGWRPGAMARPQQQTQGHAYATPPGAQGYQAPPMRHAMSVDHGSAMKEPGELARMAACCTLTLVPREYVKDGRVPSHVALAATFQRYLDLLRLPPVITHLALFYLYRAVRQASVEGATFDPSQYSIQRLFVMAYSLADTFLDDNAYSNRSWCQVLNDGIQIREWNRAQADMWTRGLRWRLEVPDEDWRRWCGWLGAWWRDRGALEWRAAWEVHCGLAPQQRPLAHPFWRSMSVSGMSSTTIVPAPPAVQPVLPSPPVTVEERTAYFGPVPTTQPQRGEGSVSAPAATGPTGVAHRHTGSTASNASSSVSMHAVAADSDEAVSIASPSALVAGSDVDSEVDEAGYEDDLEDDIVDMYSSSSRASSEAELSPEMPPPRRTRAATVSIVTQQQQAEQAQRDIQHVQALAAAALARAAGYSQPGGVLKTSASAEFRDQQRYDSAYSGSGTPIRTHRSRVSSTSSCASAASFASGTPGAKRKPSVGRIVADAAEQWWEQTVLRRVGSIRGSDSKSSTPRAHQRQPLPRKDSAIGGMRAGERVDKWCEEVSDSEEELVSHVRVQHTASPLPY